MSLICFGLHGGLGNCLFCLPAIKHLSQRHSVHLCVQGDYPMADLFARCQYVKSVFRVGQDGSMPPANAYFCGQYPPSLRPSRGWRPCGWPHGQSKYLYPEWEQIKRLACSDSRREDVSDWFRLDQPVEKSIDFGIIPGCKPGDEWRRKKLPNLKSIVSDLHPHTMQAFGMAEEIEEANLKSFWRGQETLKSLARSLLACRVVVGTDSGITHLAASLGVPTVIIFTATCPVKGDPVGNPRVVRKIWRGLECSPCQSTPRWKACSDWKCGNILVSEVVGAAFGLLESRECGFPLPQAK